MADSSFDQLTDGADQSSEDELEDERRLPVKKRGRGDGRIWVKAKECESAEAALDVVKKENCWSVRRNFSTKDGEKVQYRCNKVKKSGVQCPAAIYLLYRADREAVSIYQTDQEHDHQDKDSARGLSAEIRQAIEGLYEDGVKMPKAILYAIEKRGLTAPPVQQLKNCLQSYKKKTEGSASMDTGEFEEWCSRRLVVPEVTQADLPFVLRYEASVDVDGNPLLKLVTSTPRLLRAGLQSKVLHADATYKLNWEGLPVVVVGTTDQDRHFHPLGLGLTSGETAEDFAFVFQGVAEGIQRLYEVQYRPKILVADAAGAITNGFAAVFGANFKRVTCWAHVIRAIDRKLNKVSNAEYRQRIRADIQELQLCTSEAVFNAVTPLFFVKWNSIRDPEIDSFLHYFNAEWISANKNWYEGYAQKTPSTNNSLESTNNRIKRECTLRSRYPMPRFLTLLEESILVKWSKERDPANSDCKRFFDVPTKTTRLFVDSYQWERKKKQILSKPRDQGFRDFYIPANEQMALSPAEINAYRVAFTNLNWPSFEEYAVMRNRLWVVAMRDNQWESATCNCPAFLKFFLCKHVIGIAIRKELVEVPRAALAVPIGQKRKRGRPRLASAALVRD